VPDDSWRRLLEVDRASNELPHLAMEVLAVQRQSNLDVSQFTKDEVTQLIELIEARVRDPQHRMHLVRGSTFCSSFDARIFRVI